jgi:hypothetical protein
MKRLSAVISLLAMVLMVSQVLAQSMPTDPIGGKPPAGSEPSVTDLEDRNRRLRIWTTR